MKTPNTKIQAPEKLQSPSSNKWYRCGIWDLEFGISLELGV
jgi:hypothetical protein